MEIINCWLEFVDNINRKHGKGDAQPDEVSKYRVYSRNGDRLSPVGKRNQICSDADRAVCVAIDVLQTKCLGRNHKF